MNDLVCANDTTAEHLADCLMPEANPQDRDFTAQLAYELLCDARILWEPWAGRDHNSLIVLFANLVDGRHVVADDLDLCAEVCEQLIDVIGE